jgi:DNA transformation protein and related proteins
MAAPRDRYLEFVMGELAPLGQITSRYMFGGWCLYCDGTVFALVADGALYLKGDSQNIPKFEARGLKPFQPFPDQDLIMKYFQAPPEIFEHPEAMKEWCGEAIAAGRRVPAKKKRAGAKAARHDRR